MSTLQHSPTRARGARLLRALIACAGFLCLPLAAAPAAAQTTWFVAPGGNDANNGLSPGTALATIQEAIDRAALSGDTISVAPGTYSEPPILWEEKSLALVGAGANFTTLDSSLIQADPLPTMTLLDVPNTARIEGIAFVNGFSTLVGGLLLDESSPTVDNCAFVFNLGDVTGGLLAFDSSPLVVNCTFVVNEGFFGGGFLGVGGLPVVQDCLFGGNLAFAGGGAMLLGDEPAVENAEADDAQVGGVITHSIFEANAAVFGGGVAVVEGDAMIINSLFSLNEAFDGVGGGIYAENAFVEVLHCTLSANEAPIGGGIGHFASTVDVLNSIIWNNPAEPIGGSAGEPGSTVTVNFSNVGPLGLIVLPENLSVGRFLGPIRRQVFPGTGNINADPLFVRDPHTLSSDDPGDLRLQEGSPSIDAGLLTVGLPQTDLDGNPRVSGPAPDQGAFEFQVEVVPPPDDPLGQCHALIEQIEEMVQQGQLARNIGTSLVARVEMACRLIEAGWDSAAASSLQGFINQVNNLVRLRRIDPGVGAELVQSAQQIINQLR